MATVSAASWCRHCGDLEDMTEEHVPPRSVGNSSRVTGWIDDEPDAPVVYEAGHSQPNLCWDCNQKGTRWGLVREYSRWHRWFESEARRRVDKTGLDPFAVGKAWHIDVPYDFMPRRFIGHAVSMVLSMQRDQAFLSSHTELRALVGGDRRSSDRPPGAVDLAGIRVCLGLANRPWLFSRNPFLSFRSHLAAVRASGLWTPGWTEHAELVVGCFSPFVLTLVLKGTAWPELGYEVTHWTAMNHSDRLPRRSLRLTLPVVAPAVPTAAGLAS